MNTVAQQLFDFLTDMFYSPTKASLDMDALPTDFQELGRGLQYLQKCIAEATQLSHALAKGDLNYAFLPPPENEMAAPLKGLHASLKHLTWQTQQVAMGDYEQHINFMGEYADAFNTMIQQLDQRRTALLMEIERNQQKVVELKQSNRLLETVARQIPNWIIVVDIASKQWLFSNRDVRQMLLDAKEDGMFYDWLNQQIADIKNHALPLTTELELPLDDGMQSFHIDVQAIHWQEKDALAFVLTDVSQEKAQIRSLSNYAYYDALTDLPNRRYSMIVLDEWLAQKREFCLCFIDLDNLKHVNDTYGHDQGDQYLLSVVECLHMNFPDAVLSRIGGDEFMLLLPNTFDGDVIEQLNSLRFLMFEENPHPYIQSFSYGVVCVLANNILTASELLHNADSHMYDFKRNYKSHYI